MSKRGLNNQEFFNHKKGVIEEDGKKIPINKINEEPEEEIVFVNENEFDNVVISDDEEINNQENTNTNDYVSTNYEKPKKQAIVNEQYLKDANLTWSFNKKWWYIKKYTNKNNEEINRWNDRMKTYNDYIWWLRMNYSKEVYNDDEDKNKVIVEGKLEIKFDEETKRHYYVPIKDENDKCTFIMKFKEGTKTYSERDIIKKYKNFKGITTNTLIDEEIPVLLIGKPVPRGKTFIINYSSFDYELEREFIKDYIDSTIITGLNLDKDEMNNNILFIIKYKNALAI